MTAVRVLAIALVLAAPLPAVADPTCGGGVMAGGMRTELGDDDSPSGRSVGASLEAGDFFGAHSAVSLQLSWATTRDRAVADPFDPVSYDLSVHWLEAAAAYQRYLGSRAWVGARLGGGYLWIVQHDDARQRWGNQGFGASTGARVGYDVHRDSRGALQIVADGELLFLGDGVDSPVGAFIAQLGVAYQRR